MAKRITEYIDTPKSGGLTALKQLRQLVDRYPYYQAARMLLLRALYETHDPSFGQELRKAALYVPSRKVLYTLIEADRLKPKPEPKVKRIEEDVEENGDRTYSLIDQFLNTTEEIPQRKTRPAVDASTDYIGYMQQLEEDVSGSQMLEDLPKPTFNQQVIDTFLKQGKIKIEDHPDEELQKPQIDNESAPNNDFLTETLARIYIKQGKYDNALEIIHPLSLKHQKKNRYFADHIRYLGKIIANNNNNK